MEDVKSYHDALDIPDENLENTTRGFIISVGESGALYGRSSDRQAIVNNGGNDPLGG